eukprot:1556755-Amphidinium_carterae.1
MRVCTYHTDLGSCIASRELALMTDIGAEVLITQTALRDNVAFDHAGHHGCPEWLLSSHRLRQVNSRLHRRRCVRSLHSAGKDKDRSTCADGEHSTQAGAKAVQAARAPLETIVEAAARGSHASVGVNCTAHAWLICRYLAKIDGRRPHRQGKGKCNHGETAEAQIIGKVRAYGLSEKDRWNADAVLSVFGLPWKTKPDKPGGDFPQSARCTEKNSKARLRPRNAF